MTTEHRFRVFTIKWLIAVNFDQIRLRIKAFEIDKEINWSLRNCLKIKREAQRDGKRSTLQPLGKDNDGREKGREPGLQMPRDG